jgi:hypothetical protein
MLVYIKVNKQGNRWFYWAMDVVFWGGMPLLHADTWTGIKIGVCLQ